MFNLDFERNYNKQSQGRNIYVRPSSGNDGATGLTPAAALKTLTAALAMATADQNDVVYLMAESNTAASTTDYQSVTLDWNKNGVHLIGVNGGQRMGQRSRIAFISTYVTASNLLTVSASGCHFENLEIYAGVADADPVGCLKVTGTRNSFKNCHIAGIGDTNMDIANAYSVYLYGNATENYFEDCVIGTDTVARGTSSAVNEILLAANGASIPARNVFRGCLIIGLCKTAANYFFVKATDFGRFLLFQDCVFINAGATAGGATMTYAMAITSTAHGRVILHNTSITGAADMDNNPGNIFTNMAIPASATDAGLTIAVVKT
jgi:hypothetical protein